MKDRYISNVFILNIILYMSGITKCTNGQEDTIVAGVNNTNNRDTDRENKSNNASSYNIIQFLGLKDFIPRTQVDKVTSETAKYQGTYTGTLDEHDDLMMPDLRLEEHITHKCNMSINKTSASVFKHAVEVFSPKFAKVNLKFRYEHNVTSGGPYLLERSTSFTEYAILPYQWFWTYYSPDGFFPYLSWPVDFSILSFGLLGLRTMRSEYLVVEIKNKNCEVVLGNSVSVTSIGYALRNLTQEYILPLDNNTFGFTYWCYLSEIPGVKRTSAYQFGIYLAYPVEFYTYNCCRTDLYYTEPRGFSIDCARHVTRMWQVTLIPYMLGLFAFAIFPLYLFKCAHRLKAIGMKHKQTHEFHILSEDNLTETLHGDEIVFLDSTPPVSITILIGGMCGLVNKYPVAVSRIRRAMFILFSPFLLLCEVLIYYNFEYEISMELLEHGCPMGYLSMIGGFEKSRSNFAPMLGGPYCLIAIFWIAGFLFLLLPRHLNAIIYHGTLRYSRFGEISPLFLDTETIERYSCIQLSTIYCGYQRIHRQSLAMFYSLVNPCFWYDSFCIYSYRLKMMWGSNLIYKIIFIIFILPTYVVFCLLESFFCIIYYGIPVLNTICMLATGYMVWMLKCLRRRRESSHGHLLILCITNIVKTIFVLMIICLFFYSLFSFCTIFICSFSFVAEVVAFSFIAVVVFPSPSFGYLFFGVIFIYYIYKTFAGIGEKYLELLADAVEVSTQLEYDLYRSHVVNGTVIIDDAVRAEITKLQISDKVINLSTDQRASLREASRSRQPKVVQQHHKVGIPRDLFTVLIRKLLPVHIEVTHALFKLFLIVILIAISISVVVIRSVGRNEGISEVMHVVFVVAVGALPKVLEVALESRNHSVGREIHLREVRSIISDYWTQKN